MVYHLRLPKMINLPRLAKTGLTLKGTSTGKNDDQATTMAPQNKRWQTRFFSKTVRAKKKTRGVNMFLTCNCINPYHKIKADVKWSKWKMNLHFKFIYSSKMYLIAKRMLYWLHCYTAVNRCCMRLRLLWQWRHPRVTFWRCYMRTNTAFL